MISNLKELIGLGSETLKELFEAWFAVVTRPREFISSLDLDSNTTLTKASVFAVFISVVNLILSAPGLRTVGVQVESPVYILSDTVLTYLSFLIAGLVYHLAAKIVRGHGTVRGSVIGFLYLTALLPMGALVSLAANTSRIVSQVTQHDLDTNPFGALLRLSIEAAEKSPLLGILGVLWLGYIVFFLIWGSRVFGVVHQVGRVRAALLSIMGYVLYLSSGAIFLAPAELELRRAFIG